LKSLTEPLSFQLIRFNPIGRGYVVPLVANADTPSFPTNPI